MNTARWGPIWWRALHGLPWLMCADRGDYEIGDAAADASPRLPSMGAVADDEAASGRCVRCTPARRHLAIALTLRFADVLPCADCRQSFARLLAHTPPDAIWGDEPPCRRHRWARFLSDAHDAVTRDVNKTAATGARWTTKRLYDTYGGDDADVRLQSVVALWHVIMMAAWNFERRTTETEHERQRAYAAFYGAVDDWWRVAIDHEGLFRADAGGAMPSEPSGDAWKRWTYAQYEAWYVRNGEPANAPPPCARRLNEWYETMREPDGACTLSPVDGSIRCVTGGE